MTLCVYQHFLYKACVSYSDGVKCVWVQVTGSAIPATVGHIDLPFSPVGGG